MIKMGFFDKFKDHITHPFDLKKGHAFFKKVDPLLTYGTEGLMRAEDTLSSNIWKAAGQDEMSGFHASDAKDSSRAYTHRGIAGALALGGMALGGLGAGSSAGSSASAGSGVSAGGTGAAGGGANWMKLAQQGMGILGNRGGGVGAQAQYQPVSVYDNNSWVEAPQQLDVSSDPYKAALVQMLRQKGVA